ncbi:hypothetical protein F4782DRAFT_504254 [Xylaria castorea]|nr:hypothetical protein F4782DRAFT_504254 [Xylaria castorea]
MPVSQTTTRITRGEWEYRKHRLIKLYLDLGLRLSGPNGVIETMANEGFIATKAQYEHQFRIWNMRKNMKRHEYERIIQGRQDGGELAPITLEGRVISNARSKRALRRYARGITQAEGSGPRDDDDVAWGNTAPLTSIGGSHTPAENLVSKAPTSTTGSDNRASDMAINVEFSPLNLDQGGSLTEQANETIDMPFLEDYGAFRPYVDIDDPINLVDFSLPGLAGGWFDMTRDSIRYSPNSMTVASAGSPNALSWQARTLQRSQWIPPSAEITAMVIKGFCNAASTTSTRDVMSKFCDLASDFLGDIKSVDKGRPSADFPLVLRDLLSLETLFGEDFAKLPSNVTSYVATEARLYCRLIQSAINGFAGLEGIPAAGILKFLNKNHTTSLSMIPFLGSDSNPATKSLTENIFTAALEQDNVSIVNYLLTYRKSVHANDTVCYYCGERYTPLEIAAINQSYGVIKLLVEQNVDVNKSFSQSGPYHYTSSALNLLLKSLDPKSTIGDKLLGMVDQLLLAGAEVSVDYTCVQLDRFVDKRLAIRFIGHCASQAPEEMVSPELLEKISEILTKPDAEKTIKVVVERYQRVRADVLVRKYLATYERRKMANNIETLITALQSGDQDCLLALEENDILERLNCHELGKAFTIALKEGNLQFATKILDFDPDFYFAEHWSFTSDDAIRAALAHDFDDIAWELSTILIAAGRNPPLDTAVEQRKLDFVRGILEAGFKLKASRWMPLSRDHGVEAFRILKAAIEWGDNSIIRDLWQARSGAIYPWPDLMKLIVEKGQMNLFWDIFEAWGIRNPNDSWPGAISIAIECHDLRLLDEMVSRGARLDDDEALETALTDHSSMVRPLLERYRQAYPEGSVGYGRGAIELTVAKYPQFSEWLDVFFEFNLVRGKVLGEGKNGVTLLAQAISLDERHWKEEHLKKNLVEKLLDVGSDVNATIAEDEYEQPYIRTTAFLLAIQTENEEVVRLLIQRGAEVNKPARFGIRRTPLQMAVELNNFEIVIALLENDAEVNAPPAIFGGATALQLAAINGNCKIAMTLLEHGARLDTSPSQGPQGRWPLEGAAENGRLDMIQLLWDANNGPFDDKQCRKAMRLAEYHGRLGCRDLIKELIAKSSRGP